MNLRRTYRSFIYLKRFLIEKIELMHFQNEWRNLNQHNGTRAVNKFNSKKVNVGKYSYGPLEIYEYLNPEERLEIGSFVSIADHVRFILGGNHSINSFSTYPFKVKILKQEFEANTKGTIFIGDDVWIGVGVTILSGVKIGQGSIVGAGTLVTKDIPPYSVVVGNPARIIRNRFEDDLLHDLLKLKFDDLILDNTNENYDLLYDNCDKLTLNKIKKIFFNSSKNKENDI